MFGSKNIPDDIYYPQSQQKNASVAVLFVTADKTEDIEFFYPYYRFIEEGFRVDVATPDGGAFAGKQGLGLKESLKIKDVNPQQYDLLYIPGGKAPAALKKNKDAIELTRQFAMTGRPIAAVCHGPQLLAAADIIQGCQIAAWPEVESEVKEAGAHYVNQECCVDGQFVTARWPADLPAHVARTLEVLRHAKQTMSQRSAAA